MIPDKSTVSESFEEEGVAMKQYRSCAGTLLKIAVLLFAGCLAASAQTRGTSAQAVLHIRINIVPVVMAPRAPVEARTLAPVVSYNIPTLNSRVDVVEEVHSYSVPVSAGLSAGQAAVLKTTTIVSR